MIKKKVSYIIYIFPIIIVFICLFIGIYYTKGNTSSYLKGSSKYWDVALEVKNSRLQNTLVFTYKNNINDLKEIKKISFAKGDGDSTQIVSIGDNSFKEYLTNKGLYQQELNVNNKISFIEFNKLNTKSFSIDFDNNYDLVNSLKDLKEDKILIEINWYYSLDNNSEFKDTIQIDKF